MNRTPSRLLVAAICAVVGAVAISLGRPFSERPALSITDAGDVVDSAPQWLTRIDTVQSGETPVQVLQRSGISSVEATRALGAAPSIDARNVRAGTTILTRLANDTSAAEIIFQLAIDRLVRISRTTGSDWTESEEILPWQIDTVVVGGEVRSSLVDAIVRGAEAFPTGKRTEVAYALAQILEYRVDLSRDLQKGDSIRVLLERKTAPNGAVQRGDILAARITVAGRKVETVRFAGGATSARYLDGEGKTMRSSFLRAPLEFRRISSNFGKRKHPILGVWRAHQGIDYAANRGTPVRSVSDGTVIFAGWKGGYGRVVEVRHRNGFVTRYGHLNAFAKGIRRGASVGISSTIAYVGSTGLATAPHLHFEVLVNGVQRNPSQALKTTDGGEALASRERAAFASLKDRLIARLDSPISGAPINSGNGLDESLMMRVDAMRAAGADE